LILLFVKRTNAINEMRNRLTVAPESATDTPPAALRAAPPHHACAHERLSFALIDFGHNIPLVEFGNDDTN
jgi:hypothetical protein